MDNEFEVDEFLFRVVIPGGIYWKEDGTITSAAFKDPNGLSTDRDMGREKNDCIECLKARPDLSGSIISFQVGNCRERDILVRYDPLDNNIYHTLVLRNSVINKLTDRQAKHLASVAAVEYRVILASIA